MSLPPGARCCNIAQWRMQDFPFGGADPLGEGGGVADLPCGRFSVKMYAKMKELGPVWGGMRRAPPRSANATVL